MITNKTYLQVVLNNREKEQLVVKLYQEGKSIREIAQQAHLSFGTIGKMVRRINSRDKDEILPNDMSTKGKETHALSMFLQGKRPVDVAIELDLSSSEVENILQEFWVLNKLDELACIHPEIKNHLDLFLQLFHAMKKNKQINQKDIKTILRYADDLPSLENKFRGIANTVLDLEIKKKELDAQLLDLGHLKKQYQNAIDMKRERLSNLELTMSQLAIRCGKRKSEKA